MTWLSEIEADLLGLSLPGKEGANMDARKCMARVIRELVGFIRLNIDFDSPLRPVGLHNLSPDTKKLMPETEELRK